MISKLTKTDWVDKQSSLYQLQVLPIGLESPDFGLETCQKAIRNRLSIHQCWPSPLSLHRH